MQKPKFGQQGFYWAVLTACLAAGTAGAQHNYQMYVLGDRASGMGGAAVASANSVDACYYNPAGLVLLPGNTISLSGSLYGRQYYRSPDGLYADEDVKYETFVTIPTTVGGAWKISDQSTIAFAALMPNFESYSEMRSFRDNTHIYNYNMDDQTLWVGPSVGWALNSRLSLGISLYAVYRSYNEYINLLYKELNESYARGQSFNDWSALAAIGVQYQALEKLRVGARIQSPSTHVWGEGAYQAHIVTRTETENIYLKNVDTDNRVPAQISIGAAWEEPRRYTLALDVNYYFSQDFALQSWDNDEEHLELKIRQNDVINFNVGVEYFFREIYPLRAGFFTDFSSAPGINPDDLDNTPRIDCYGVSASAGKQVDHMSVNFGLIYVFGQGRSLGWRDDGGTLNLTRTTAKTDNIYLVVNTAYMF